jgi:hypothetical protein
MLEQLLLSACEQADRSEPAVRAATLMHIARVMTRSDQAAAEQLLDEGIALAETIEGDAPSLLLRNAICLAAAVSAKHALPLYTKHRQLDPFDWTGRRFGQCDGTAWSYSRRNCVPPPPFAGRPFPLTLCRQPRTGMPR